MATEEGQGHPFFVDPNGVAPENKKQPAADPFAAVNEDKWAGVPENEQIWDSQGKPVGALRKGKAEVNESSAKKPVTVFSKDAYNPVSDQRGGRVHAIVENNETKLLSVGSVVMGDKIGKDAQKKYMLAYDKQGFGVWKEADPSVPVAYSFAGDKGRFRDASGSLLSEAKTKLLLQNALEASDSSAMQKYLNYWQYTHTYTAFETLGPTVTVGGTQFTFNKEGRKPASQAPITTYIPQPTVPSTC